MNCHTVTSAIYQGCQKSLASSKTGLPVFLPGLSSRKEATHFTQQIATLVTMGGSDYIASANHRKFSSALKIKFSTKLLSHQNKMTMLGLPSRWLTVYFKITTLTKCNSNLYASFGIISSYNHNCQSQPFFLLHYTMLIFPTLTMRCLGRKEY